jgi:hypothetical protein
VAAIIAGGVDACDADTTCAAEGETEDSATAEAADAAPGGTPAGDVAAAVDAEFAASKLCGVIW